LARRDEAEFTAFVQRQSRFVFRVAYAVLRNSHDAEDIVQEVFLKMYHNRMWQGVEDEKAYLARAAWRAALDHLPKQHLVEADETEIASVHPSPEQTALDADLQRKVHQLIDGLPEELRQPLALSTIQELTSREIAQILGIPEGTVRTRVMRARQLLREKLTALEGRNHVANHA
jgi:RNA polymerase sigma-70 factor (ECF subfamily)